MAVIKVKSAKEAAKVIMDMVRKDLQEICPHIYGSHIKVLSSIVTCETTVEVCDWCEKELDNPKTQC